MENELFDNKSLLLNIKILEKKQKFLGGEIKRTVFISVRLNKIFENKKNLIFIFIFFFLYFFNFLRELTE